MRLERQLVSLFGLLADRQKPHLGIANPEDLLREDGAHVRELAQVLRPAVRVGAGVDQNRRPAPGGQDDRDPGPVDAPQPPDLEQPRGKHGAGVPGGDGRVGSALADEPTRNDKRAVALGADGFGGFLVHRDRGRGLDELEPARVEARRADEHRSDLRRGGFERAGNDLFRGAIAPHRIDRDSNHGSGPRAQTDRRQSLRS